MKDYLDKNQVSGFFCNENKVYAIANQPNSGIEEMLALGLVKHEGFIEEEDAT